VLAFSERANRGLTDAAVSLGQTSYFRSWHKTDLLPPNRYVRYFGNNEPISYGAREV
jgi:hypothetical protein